jgi:hypothetical protein
VGPRIRLPLRAPNKLLNRQFIARVVSDGYKLLEVALHPATVHLLFGSTVDNQSPINSHIKDLKWDTGAFEVLNMGVDRRLIVNRGTKQKMYRCWMQGNLGPTALLEVALHPATVHLLFGSTVDNQSPINSQAMRTPPNKRLSP